MVVKVESGSESTKADNIKLSESRAMLLRQHLKKKFKLNETSFKSIAQATSPKGTKPESVTISVYSENRENRAITASR